MAAVLLCAFVIVGIFVPVSKGVLWRRRKDLYRINDSAELLATLDGQKAGKEPDLTDRATPTGQYIPGEDDPLVPATILGDGYVDAQSTVPRHPPDDSDRSLIIPEDSVR